MSEWKRVCCAVDFSEPSRLALEEAVDLCRRSGAELTIVHVRTPPPPTAVDLLASNPDPTEAEIRHAIEGNYCRCTGYQNIVIAIRAAAATLRAAGAPARAGA